MRVRVVAPHGFADPANPSGGNVYDRRVCAGLARLGWDVRIATVDGAWPAPDRRARTDLANVLAAVPDGETVLIDGLIASPSADPLLAHARRLRMTILLHMPLATAGPYGEATTPSEPERGVPGRTGLAPACAMPGTTAAEPERAVLGAAAGVVVTSEWTRRLVLDRYGLPAARVRVARPGADPAPVPPRNATAPPNGHLLCVAALARHKGQDVLVEALAGLASPGWTCVLAGPLDREPEHVAELRARVAGLGLGDRIRFAGTLTGAALDQAYATADLLVVPSRAETYGMVVTEALARGIPVLAAATGGLPEALGHAPGGTRPGVLFPPDDPYALRAALARWRSDPAHRDRLRAGALWRRGTLRGWDHTARDVAAALEGVSGPPR